MRTGNKQPGSDGRFLKGLRRKLADLLSEEEDAPQTQSRSTPQAHSQEQPQSGGAADSRRFLESVQTALSENTELVAGRVNFVDFERIKAKLGPRWEQVAARADEIAKREIERHLTKADLYTSLPDMRYLISFSELSPEEARLRCAMIADEIGKKLIGENLGEDTPTIQTAVARMDGQLEFEDVPSLGAMAEELYRQISGSNDVSAERSTDDSAPIENELEEDPLREVQLVYRPMWDIARNVVSTYIIVPAIRRSDNSLSIGEGSIFDIESPKVLCDLDHLIMRHALVDLKKMITQSSSYLLCVPVHFESLATTARRTDFVKLCKLVPPDLRNLLLFELVDVPAGIPQSRILELTTILRRYCRAVLMRQPLEAVKFRSAPETGVSVVGLDISGLRLSERALIKVFNKFCEGAQKAGLRTYIHGLRTMSLTTSAIAAGFEYIDGDIVVNVTDEPGGLYRFNVRNVLRRWQKKQ